MKGICKRKKRRKENFVISIFLGLLLLLMGSGVYLLSKLEPIPLVIFAGGGSVKNYIGCTKGVWIDSIKSDEIPKSVYINVPSEYGWTLLKEEIYRFKGDSKPHPFLYICLSADSITRDSINKLGLKEMVKKDSCNARIYGCHIGDDPLMVYVADAANGDKTISVDALKEKIKPFQSKYNNNGSSKKLFATSRKSGTLRRYENVLGFSFDNINNTLYYETDSLKDSDVAVVLGSKYYRPKIDNDNNDKWLYVVQENNTIKKPLYIYFVVFEEDDFKPNKQIVEFFKESLGIPIPKPISDGQGIGNELISYF